MNTTAKEILEFVENAEQEQKQRLLTNGLLKLTNLLLGLLLLFLLVDSFWAIPQWWRLAALALLLSPAILGIGFSLGKTLFGWRRKQTLRTLEQTNLWLKDDLSNALELQELKDKEHVSQELIQEHSLKVQQKLSSIQVFGPEFAQEAKQQGYKVLLLLGVFGVLYFLPPRVIQPAFQRLFGPVEINPLERLMSVSPGNASVAWGESVNILLRPQKPLEEPPHLLVKTSLGWQEVKLESGAPEYFYTVNDITSLVEYRVRWRNLKSPVYTLTPYNRPVLGEFVYTYHYPSYTGLPAQEIKGGGPIMALRGTRVEIQAACNVSLQQASLLTPTGQRQPVAIDGKTLKTELAVISESSFSFQVTDEQSRTHNDLAQISVHIQEDQNPQVKIHAPAMDLLISKDEPLPLVYEASDDFGLSQAVLVWKKGDESHKVPLQHWRQSRLKWTDHYSWSLPAGLKPGEVITYHLEALDNDTVSGPKAAISQSYQLEIKSFAREHEAIEQGLKNFREELVKLLGRQSLAKKDLTKIQNISENDSQKKSLQNQLAIRQEEMAKSLEQTVKNLESLLPRMENDPLGDYALWSEHKEMKRQLARLLEEDMKPLPEDLRRDRWQEASFKQDHVIAELERMSLLSEDALKQAHMQDLLNTASDMTKKGEDLERSLKSLEGKPQTEQLKALEKTMQQVQDLMQKLAEAMSKMPQELPEEFVNQQAIKELSLAQMQQAADQLQQALSRGDMASALKSAQEMLRQMQNMLKTLQTAADSASGGGSQSAMSQNMQEALAELEQIAKEESALAGDTDQVDKKRLDALFQAQEKLLAQLEAKQKQVLELARAISEKTQAVGEFPELYGFLAGGVSGQIPVMEKVLEEFQKKKVDQSQKYLEGIIQAFSSLSDIVQQSLQSIETQKNLRKGDKAPLEKKELLAKEVQEKMQTVSKMETEILEALRKPPEMDYTPSAEDVQAMKQMQTRQTQLQGRTQKLHQKLGDLARKTAMVDSKSLGEIQKAAQEMSQAGETLGQAKSTEALAHERKALEHLAAGQDSLENSGQGMAQMQAQGGKPMAGFLQQRGGAQGGGTTGFRHGFVRIPKPEEYMPPAEFREEILKALKEKYPKSYERLIKDYFKRLAE